MPGRRAGRLQGCHPKAAGVGWRPWAGPLAGASGGDGLAMRAARHHGRPLWLGRR